MAKYKPKDNVYVTLNGVNPSVKKAKIIYLHDDRYEKEYSEAWLSNIPISTLKTS